MVLVATTVAAANVAAAAPQLTPTLALAAYQAAMTNASKPPNMTFEYTQIRSGPKRIITEVHRVYRDGAGDERNDTISVNGSAVAPPITRTYHNRAWPYDADNFVASTDEYELTPGPASVVAGKLAYAYAAKRKAPASFQIQTLYLATDTGMPVRELFTADGTSCSGRGSIDFVTVGGYRLPSSISVSCAAARTTDPAGQPETYRETIKFSSYTFPERMPPEIFGA